MTKQEREEKLIDLKARQLMKQRQLDELSPDASTEETINAIVEEIKTIQDAIAEITNTQSDEEVPAEEMPAEVEEKAEDEEEISQEEIDKENEELLEEERKKMTNNEIRKVTIETAEQRAAQMKEYEERKETLKRENRSVMVSTHEILLPQHQSDNLAGVPFQQVSSLLDMVNVKTYNGGETYKQPFTIAHGVAGTILEGQPYTETDSTFGTATVSKIKVTAKKVYSEELEKLPAADYVAELNKGIEEELRKKLAQQILVGDGTNTSFKGILANGVEALEDDDYVEVSAITDTTLDDIIGEYGGEEAHEANATLILNKKTVNAFAKLRNTDGTKTYDVVRRGATGTIDGVPYVINSNMPTLEQAEAGNTFILYGDPKGYEIGIFSPVEIMKSYDERFSNGEVVIKAAVWAGGNVTKYRSFLKVKKGANV